METDETGALYSINISKESYRKAKDGNESESDDSSDEDIENVKPNTRNRTRKIKIDGTEDNDNSERIHRVRTRSQCSVDGELNESKETSRKLRTRDRKHSDVEESDLDSSTSVKRGNLTTIRTRSMGDSESEKKVDKLKDKVDKSKKASPVRRMRTRSSKLDSSDEEMFNDEDDDSDDDEGDEEERMNEEEESDGDVEMNEVDDKRKGKKRLSAIHESEDEMEIDEAENDNLDVDKHADEGKNKKVGRKGDKSSKQDEGIAVVKKQRKAAAGSLLVQLELFAKFKDPKSMYMEPQLRQLYFDVSCFT
jgi:hypothetical protein